jgi:hypothetical protein
MSGIYSDNQLVKEIEDLEDVSLSSLADEEVLKYDASTKLWKNGVAGPGDDITCETLQVNSTANVDGTGTIDDLLIKRHFTTIAGLGHRDYYSTNNNGFALAQSNNGDTIINAGSGRAITFRVNNSQQPLYITNTASVFSREVELTTGTELKTNGSYGTSGAVLTSRGSGFSPIWTEPYYFLAEMTASQTISNTTYTDITNLSINSNATTSNASSDFASNSWTVSQTGVYFISCSTKVFPPGGTPITSSNISRIIFVFADSANNQIRTCETMNEENSTGEDIFGKTLSINGIIYLTAGTTYKLRVWVRRNPSGNSQVIYGTPTRADTFISAYKIG